MSNSLTKIIQSHRPDLSPYETLYKHLHANPELSTQEAETATLIADRLAKLSPDLDIRTNIGGHGLVAILKNGDGKTVLLRADIDGLPVEEKTGLEYSSTKKMVDKVDAIEKAVMHACGHDTHITCLLAAAELLLSARDSWSGTIIFLFQPAEERAVGARAMVSDGLYSPDKHAVPIPDIVLGQHVLPLPAGHVGTRAGPFMSAADSFKITIYGRGGHGSMPYRCIDPVLIASHVVVRLQTIVAREVPADEVAVVTVGALQAGATENIIPAEALLRVNIRSVSAEWRGKILESVKRIVRAECVAGNCPKEPLIEPTSNFPLTVNDPSLTGRLDEVFHDHFGSKHQPNLKSVLGSEDFGILGSAVDRPYCFWVFGGVDLENWKKMEEQGKLDEIPVNHSPFFAPVIEPTLTTGIDAMALAALAFLRSEK